ncbi:MAG: T9SS type A sorting domain-containing protein [Bacteroidota bacterium]
MSTGINLYDDSYPYTPNVLIEYNSFSSNTDGIYLSQIGLTTIRYNNCVSGDALTLLETNIDEIHHNIFQSPGGQSAVFQFCWGTPSNWAKIYNNTFASNNTSQITNTCVALAGFDYGEFYNNSVYYNATYNYQAAFQAGNLDTVRIYNNIFMNAGAGYAYWLQTNIYGFWSDNNVIFTNGTQISSNGVTTPSQFQALYNTDYNSLFVNPQYVNPLTNLRPTNPLIDGLAVSTSWITDDFTGVPRHPQYPDPGAYEFSVVPNVSLGADITQCGGTAMLNAANNGSYYLWSTGQTTQSISPSISGTYWVDVTNLAGIDRDTINVTIHSLPVANAGTNNSFCIGGSVSLNGSGGTSAVWQPVLGLSNSTVYNPIASPGNTTTYTLTVTDGNNCQAQDSVLITVHSLPSANAGSPVSSCIGDSVTLSGSGGVNCNWFPASGLSDSTSCNPVATTTSSTAFVLEVTDANGCTDRDTVQVIVNPLPTVTVCCDDTICFGDTISITAGGTATAYNWIPATYLNNTNIPNVQAWPGSSITYTVSGTDGNNCSNTSTVSVTVNPLPLTPMILQNGGTLSTNAIGILQWLLYGVPIPAADSSSYAPIQTGDYSVSVTDSVTNCSSLSANYFFNSVGLNNVANTQAQTLYINGSQLLIISGIAAGNYQINCFNPKGQLVFVKSFVHSSEQTTLSVSHLSDGMYFIHLHSEQGYQNVLRIMVLGNR